MRVRRDADRPPDERLSVEQVKPARLVLANPGDTVDCKERCEPSDGGGKSSKNAKLRAIVAIITIEGIADKAAIARLPREQANLSLELDRSS